MQQSQPKGKVGELPAALYERQSWRPPAVNAAESFLSGLTGRSEPFMNNAVRLSRWYEQFSRRVQPWSGWPPLSLEFRIENLSQGKEGARGAKDYSSKLQPPLSQKPSTQPAVSNSAIRLSILRTIYATKNTTHPSRADNWSELPVLLREELPHPLRDRIYWRSLPQAEILPLLPRLVVSVSPTPRREVRGGFPSDTHLLSTLPIDERISAKPASFPVAQQNVAQEILSSPLPWQTVIQPDALPATPEAMVNNITSSPSEKPGAIETLIERMVLPEPLPKLEMRLVSPEQHQASSTRLTPNTANDGQKATHLTPELPAPAPPATAPLDVNAIADKVYQKLLRRQQLERERRGLY